MKTEIEITEIVKRHGGKHLQFGNVPSWVDKNQQEGLELKAGILKSFWIKDGGRVYDEPISDSWGKCLVEVLDNSKKEEEKKTEQVNTPQSVAVPVGLIPDTLTLPLLEKWKKQTAFERMLAFQNTPDDMIETRPGPGGSKLKYVKGNKMIQELNIAFLFNWSSTIEEVKETETGYWVRGYITVEADNVSITRAAIGTADKHKGVSSEDVAKAAAMDMIKKAASSLGFNGDVYRGEV